MLAARRREARHRRLATEELEEMALPRRPRSLLLFSTAAAAVEVELQHFQLAMAATAAMPLVSVAAAAAAAVARPRPAAREEQGAQALEAK